MLAIVTGVIQKLSSIFIAFFSQWVFIHYLGMEYVSVDGLFSSVLTFLSLAELGVGSAITVYLYKPLAEKDTRAIQSYMHFYKQCYRVIGWVILILGLCLVPVLDRLVNFDNAPPINLYLVYLLFLFNSVSSYWFFAYKSSIISADQKGYLINNLNTVFTVAASLGKCAVVLLTRNFVAALVTELVIGLAKNLVIAHKADQLYPFIREKKADPIPKQAMQRMFRDVRAMFLNNLSFKLLSATDNLVISALLSTILIGYASTYTKIINQVVMVIAMLTVSFGASIGNLVTKETLSRKLEVFGQLHLANFWISCVSSVCLFQLLTPFVRLFYGDRPELQAGVLSMDLVACLVLHFYFGTAANVLDTFKTSMGLLRQGCYLAIFGGVLNLVLDFTLGPRLGLLGIYLATLIAEVGTTYFPKGFYVYRDGFHLPPVPFLFKMLRQLLLTVGCVALTSLCCAWVKETTLFTFLAQGVISAVVPNLVLLAVYGRSEEFRGILQRLAPVLNKTPLRALVKPGKDEP